MKKSVDIDALLAKDRFILTLGGKIYELEDIPVSVFMTAVGSDVAEDALHKQLASILNVDQEKLSHIGLKAAALALKAIRDWVTESGFGEDEVAKPDSANP